MTTPETVLDRPLQDLFNTDKIDRACANNASNTILQERILTYISTHPTTPYRDLLTDIGVSELYPIIVVRDFAATPDDYPRLHALTRVFADHASQQPPDWRRRKP